jgi:hypothetical protein
MSKHNHPEPTVGCSHADLRFCKQCECVECIGCGAEFFAKDPFDELRKILPQSQKIDKFPYNDRIWCVNDSNRNIDGGPSTYSISLQ